MLKGSARLFIGTRFVADTASNAERANPAWTPSEGVSTTAAPTGAPCRLRRHRLAGWSRRFSFLSYRPNTGGGGERALSEASRLSGVCRKVLFPILEGGLQCSTTSL